MKRFRGILRKTGQKDLDKTEKLWYIIWKDDDEAPEHRRRAESLRTVQAGRLRCSIGIPSESARPSPVGGKRARAAALRRTVERFLPTGGAPDVPAKMSGTAESIRLMAVAVGRFLFATPAVCLPESRPSRAPHQFCKLERKSWQRTTPAH